MLEDSMYLYIYTYMLVFSKCRNHTSEYIVCSKVFLFAKYIKNGNDKRYKQYIEFKKTFVCMKLEK